MIKINKIEPFTCEAFNPEGESLGFLNLYEFYDLRIQIAKEKAEGYYMMFGDTRINIKKNGKTDRYPNGFYDSTTNQLRELLKY